MEMDYKAIELLEKAIKLHQVHMDYPKTADVESQNKLMMYIKDAHNSLKENFIEEKMKGVEF